MYGVGWDECVCVGSRGGGGGEVAGSMGRVGGHMATKGCAFATKDPKRPPDPFLARVCACPGR